MTGHVQRAQDPPVAEVALCRHMPCQCQLSMLVMLYFQVAIS